MPTVAEQLRTAREAQGLTVYQVADVTKIRTDHVRALEKGDYGVFAAPVYIRGFVRSCAMVLKLDAGSVLSQLDAELEQNEKFRETPLLAGGPRGFLDVVMLQLAMVNWRVALPSLGIAFALLVAVFGYRAWRGHQARDPLADLGPGIYQPQNPNAGDTLPLPAQQKN